MAAVPQSGLALHGVPSGGHESKHAHDPLAILFKLDDDVLKDVRKASSMQGGLQFVTGAVPRFRLGKRTIDLTISPEAFHYELYSATTRSLGDLTFAGVVGHRAELKVPERKESIGSDAALAALQNSLESYKQEKQSNAVNISQSVIVAPKNRFEANRAQKSAHRRNLSGSQHPSPALSASATPRIGLAPTSMPTIDSSGRIKAMRKPLVHLLAMRPMSTIDITSTTHIPKNDLDELLQKVGKPVDGKWQLADRAYKELDVWEFGYTSQEDRQACIDNAIKAYDRQRISKEDDIWQQLLPKKDRDQGIYLSKLHIGAVASHLTPRYGSSPMPHGDGEFGSAANTPRLGAHTPKVGGGKSDLMKRLSAKNPKQRAVEDAKEKKRKEREAALAAAASDREGQPTKKKQTTKSNNPKVKSAELVSNSSDESGEENDVGGGITKSKQPKALSNAVPSPSTKPKARPVASTTTNANSKIRPTTTASTSSVRPLAAAATSPPSSATTNSATTIKPRPAALGKSTPTHGNGLSAPASQHRSQLSPQNQHRPPAPSPLGAARPRVASDVSDRGAVGVQRIRQGADTPRGLGITNANSIRKRHDTVTSTDSFHSSTSDRANGMASKSDTERARNPAGNGVATPKAPFANGSSHKAENGVKRKAVDSPTQSRENGRPIKHRKADSSSTSSHKSQNSVGAASSMDELDRSTSSDSASSILLDITYSQGVTLAQKFHDEYYPRYAKLYDEQAAMEKRGEAVPKEERAKLWQMHRRLETMKREIHAASRREGED